MGPEGQGETCAGTGEQALLARALCQRLQQGCPHSGPHFPLCKMGIINLPLAVRLTSTEIRDPSVWKQCCCLVQRFVTLGPWSLPALTPRALLCPPCCFPAWRFFSRPTTPKWPEARPRTMR